MMPISGWRSRVVKGRFYNCGQTCTAVKRLSLYESIADEFVRRLVARVEAIQVGNGMDPGVGMGPMNNRQGLDRLTRQVDAARERDEGEIIAGGKAPEGERYERGFFFLPTLIAGVPHDSVLFSEEVFGPALPIATVRISMRLLSGQTIAVTVSGHRYGPGTQTSSPGRPGTRCRYRLGQPAPAHPARCAVRGTKGAAPEGRTAPGRSMTTPRKRPY